MTILTGAIPDQYYATTSRLTNAGHQRTVMRVTAGCILILGLPAMLAAGNSNASNIPGGRALLAIVPVACVLLASPWMRYRWPTRTQSATVVILGSLLLAAGSIVPVNPFSGLLISTAFSFVLGYAVLFHGTRLQIFVTALAAATILWLAIVIGKTDIPTAIAVTTPVILINTAVLVGCRIIAQVAATGEHTDIEPLTGLLTRESFDEAAGTLMGARQRDDDKHLVLALVAIDRFAALHSVQGTRGADRARVAVGKALRDTVRHDAVIAHVRESEFLLADTFTTPDPSPLAERIRGAVAAAPGGITASIGVVCIPLRPLADRPPNEVLDEMIALATTAMYRASRHGGNAIEYVHERGYQRE